MRIDGATAVLAGPTLRVRMARDQQAEIEAVVSAAAGRAVTIELTEADATATAPAPSDPAAADDDESGSVATTQDQTGGDEPTAPPPTPDEEAQHPLVRLAAEQFGARVTGVHPKRHD